MWDLAVREDDYRRTDSLLARYRGPAPLSMRLIPTLGRSDSAAFRTLLAEAKGLESRQLQIGARYVATYLEDFALADSLARLDLEWRQRPANRANAQLLLAWLAVVAGRWSAAKAEFVTAEVMEGAGPVVIHRAFAALTPFLAVPAEHLTQIRAEVERWRPGSESAAGLAAVLEPHLRLYLMGLLSSRLGDAGGAARYAAALDQLAAPAVARPLARGMAATVRADLAWREGRYQAVINALPATDETIPLELVVLPRPAHLRMYGLEYARFLRGAALSALGRDADALRWLRFGLRGSPQEFAFHPSVHLELGRLFERLGQSDSAMAHYRQFLNVWREPDPGATQMVEDVRSRLARLEKR